MWAPDPPPSRRPSISFILAVLFASTTCYLLFVSTHAPDASHPNGIQTQQDNFQSASSLFPRSSLLHHDPDTDVIPTIPVEESLTPSPPHDANDDDADTDTIQPKPHDDDDKDGNSDKKHKSTHNEDHDQDENDHEDKDKDKDKGPSDSDKKKRKKQDDHDDEDGKKGKKKHKNKDDQDDQHDEEDKKNNKKNKKTRDHDDQEDDHDHDKDKNKKDNKDKKGRKNKKNKDDKKNKNKKDNHQDDHDDDKSNQKHSENKDTNKNANHDSSSRPYRVLLFGDSITYGTGPNPIHPYSIRLQEKFDKHGIAVELINQGINSNFVVQDPRQTAMIDRLPDFLPIAPQNNTSHDTAPLKEPPPPKFDMVIILGGTNDISNKVGASDTLAGLISMHERVRPNGAITVALTVPERNGEILVKPPYVNKNGEAIGDSVDQQNYSRRMIINQGLESYCTQHQPMKHGRTATGEMPCVLVDFAHEIPYKQRKYWIDTVHPSAAGYDRLGELIWDVIEPYVSL